LELFSSFDYVLSFLMITHSELDDLIRLQQDKTQKLFLPFVEKFNHIVPTIEVSRDKIRGFFSKFIDTGRVEGVDFFDVFEGFDVFLLIYLNVTEIMGDLRSKAWLCFLIQKDELSA
jgi:hypothetical protein